MMRLFLLISIFSTHLSSVFCQYNGIKEGDIIFHKSVGPQSRFVEMATHSTYTHCGIIFQIAGQWQVLEAVEPVKYTPLEQWIKRGKDSKYVIKRLKESDQLLSAEVLKKMKQEGNAMLSKHYDLLFEWDDSKLYCSELVWKIFKHNANVELGHLQKLKDFDLSNPTIQVAMKQRYGPNIPYDQEVISPSEIFDSPLLITVLSR